MIHNYFSLAIPNIYIQRQFSRRNVITNIVIQIMKILDDAYQKRVCPYQVPQWNQQFSASLQDVGHLNQFAFCFSLFSISKIVARIYTCCQSNRPPSLHVWEGVESHRVPSTVNKMSSMVHYKIQLSVLFYNSTLLLPSVDIQECHWDLLRMDQQRQKNLYYNS